MKALVWICLAACGSTRPPAVPDAAAPDAPDAPDAAPFHRQRDATNVIVGADRVVWSYGSEPCPIPLRDACPELSPTVLASTGPTASPVAWEQTRGGVTIAGDENEVFLVDDTHDVVRVRPGEATTVLARADIDWNGPVVDATYVYWAGDGTGAFELRRTTRAGDGSDAEVIATTPLRPAGLVLFAGYLYWGDLRVPITGGTPAAFTSEADLSVIAAGPDALYTRQYLPPNGYTVRVATLTIDGTLTPLVDLPQAEAPDWYGIYDRGELLWTTGSGELLALAASGGTPRTIGSVANGGANVFAATADSILYNFTDTGYETMPR